MFKMLFCLLMLSVGHLLNLVDSMQHFYWRDYRHGEIPCDAFEAAPGVYIGQVLFDTGLYVAAIYPYRNSVVAMRGPRVDVTQSIKIFCTSEPKNFYWQSVNFSRGDGIQMIDAVHGGYQEQRWEQFIGRVEHLNNWKVGKVYDIEINDGPGMYVWGPDGDKVVLLEFELLKSNATTTSHECSVVKYRL